MLTFITEWRLSAIVIVKSIQRKHSRFLHNKQFQEDHYIVIKSISTENTYVFFTSFIWENIIIYRIDRTTGE